MAGGNETEGTERRLSQLVNDCITIATGCTDDAYLNLLTFVFSKQIVEIHNYFPLPVPFLSTFMTTGVKSIATVRTMNTHEIG